MLGADGRVVEAGGDGIGVKRLAFGILQQVALGALEHAELTCARRKPDRVAPGFGALSAGFEPVQVHPVVVEERVHDADRV